MHKSSSSASGQPPAHHPIRPFPKISYSVPYRAHASVSSTPTHRTAAPSRNPRSHGRDLSATTYKNVASASAHELSPLFPPPSDHPRELRQFDTRGRALPGSSHTPRRRRCRRQRQLPPPTPRPRRLRRRRPPAPTRTPRQRWRPRRLTRTHCIRITICRNRGGWSSHTLLHTIPWWPRRRHLLCSL
jgi:hypothetical protein